MKLHQVKALIQYAKDQGIAFLKLTEEGSTLELTFFPDSPSQATAAQPQAAPSSHPTPASPQASPGSDPSLTSAEDSLPPPQPAIDTYPTDEDMLLWSSSGRDGVEPAE